MFPVTLEGNLWSPWFLPALNRKYNPLASFRAGLTNQARAETIGELHPSSSGPVAQLGARFHGMEEVIGSIPIRSTNKPNNLADSQKKRDTLSIRWFSCCILRSTFYDIP